MTAAATRPGRPDSGLVLHGATFWRGPRCEPHRGWLWVDDGRIRALGDDDPPPRPAWLDLHGRHVLPGLVDAHRHFMTCSLLPVCGDASGWQTRAAALAAVEVAHERAAAGSWVVFFGMDHTRWQQGWAPTARELDRVAPGRRVLLCDITLHRGVLSTPALELLALDATLPEDGFADIERDSAGRPRGMVWERAFGRALSAALAAQAGRFEPSARTRLLDDEARRMLAQGYVHVHDIGLSMDQQRALAAWHLSTPLRVSWSVASRHGLLEPPQFGEDAMVDSRHGRPSVKFFLDGAHRCAVCLPIASLVTATRTVGAAIWRQRSLNPLRASLDLGMTVRGGHVHLPHLRFADVDAIVRRARPYVEAGYRLRIHALGNRAVSAAAAAIAAMGQGAGATIEHALALDDDDIAAVAASGALVSVQPGFIPHYADAIRQQGVMPYLKPFPLRSLAARGVACTISSDAPCGPGDGLFNLRRAVDRQDESGDALAPDEALTPAEAVRAGSLGGLAALGIESSGLAVGERADLTVCSGDPFAETTVVDATWIDGAVAWSRPGAPG